MLVSSAFLSASVTPMCVPAQMIIVLRKKDEQLSFLHLWHHASIGVVWGWVVSTWPTGAEGGSAAYCYGAWVNACVHVRAAALEPCPRRA